MPKARRRTWLLAGAISIFIGVMVAVPAFADQGTAGIPLPPPPPAGSGDNVGDGGTTAGYPNASPGQAESLFTNHFSDTVDSLASDPPNLSGQHPDFLDNHTAVVSPDGSSPAIASDIESILAKDQHDVSAAKSDLNDLLDQHGAQGSNSRQLVSSALPLRTNDGDGQAPVDLSLEQQGSGYMPGNPLVDLKLPENLNNDIVLGNDRIKVDVGATDSATADPINGSDDLFYADAAPATDVVLAPISSGLESFYQLRAPESPDHFKMNFTLPSGTDLEQAPGGGAQITGTGGDTLGVIYPPAATDASGNSIDVSMSVDGASLVLDVPHSDPAISYPISVDPVVDLYTWSTDGHGILADWIANQATGSPYQLRRTCKENVDCTSGTSGPTGLYSLAPPNQAIAQYAAAVWQYQVPHYPWTTSYVSVANLGPMYFNPRTDSNANPFMFAGIYPDASGGYVDSQSRTTAAGNLYWQLSAGSATTAKQVTFGLWSFVARTPTAWRDAYDGGVAIWLGDNESPTLTDVTHSGISIGQADWSFSNWVDSATPSVSVTAQDNGLGIAGFFVPRADGTLPPAGSAFNRSENCDGTSASPCPQHPDAVSANYNTASLPNGVTLTGVVAQDALGKGMSKPFALRVDHAAPVLSSITGGLAPANPSGGAYQLKVTTTDGNASDSSGQQWQSGVKRVQEYVDGDLVADTGVQPCSANEGSCQLSLDHSIGATDYASGPLHMKVIATDELGHQRIREWDVPIPDASIDSGPSSPTSDATPTFTYHSSAASATFECRIDSGPFTSCASSGYTASTLSEGQHSFSLRATDSGGHIDPTPAIQTFSVDQTDPHLNTSGDLVASTDPLMGSDTEVDFDATDAESGVTSVEILVDGEQADEITQDCPDGACELQDILVPDLTDDGPGAHDYEIVATDAAGNTTSQLGTFRLDPTPPVLDVTGPLADANGQPINGDTADAQIDATDNSTGDSGLASVQVSVDDTVDATAALSCAPSCPGSTSQAYTFDETQWPEGPHTVTITAADAAGNTTYENLDIDAPTPPPANCPEVMPTVDDPGQVLDASEAQSAAPSVAIAPSVPTFDDVTQTDFDPSLQAGESSPPDPLSITGSLITGALSSAPAGGFSIDYVVCMVPAQTTTSETGATITNGDSALYANSAFNTDTIVRPTAGGVTIVNSLRGPDTPASFQWKVGVPDGDPLTSLSNGGVAIVDPSREPEADLTVPDRPSNADAPGSIADAATQLAEKRYQVASAEQETGHAVLAVITAPYAIDADGNSIPTTLTLSGADTVAVDSVANAKALVVTIADDQDKINPPDKVDAFPIKISAGHDELVTAARIDACRFAGSQSGGTDPLILGFGSANKQGGNLGAGMEPFFHKNNDIHDALQAAANHYRDCHKPHANAIFTYATSNYHISDHIDGEIAKHAGGAQVAWIRRVNAHANDRKAVGGDIELGWDQPGISKLLVNHAASSSFTYYEFGDANQCPPDKASCYGNWTFRDVGAVSHNGSAVALPEIYHSVNATQWARVARHWDDADHNCPESGRSCYYFAGATSEPHNCSASLDPGDSWRHLKRNNPKRTVQRALIYWNPDGCG